MVANAQLCNWEELGDLGPVKSFLAEMLENIARLHGHAAVLGVYGLDAAAAGPMGELYNYFDWSKLDVDFHRDVRDYMAKSLQWLGSYVVFDVLDVDAIQYATWRRAHPGAVHRMDDPARLAGRGPHVHLWRGGEVWHCQARREEQAEE